MKSTGFIGKDGKYHRGSQPVGEANSSLYKSWDHDRQRREHARDIIQPYLPNGSINPEFEMEYPEEAKNYHTSM